MTAPLLTKARGSATSDDGFALAVVLGMAAFLTVMALGGLYLAQQASHEAATVRSESQAFQSANAGIDMAVARLTAHGFQTADYPITLTTAELSSGSAQVNMTKVDDYEFRCVSSGQGLDGTTETVTVQLFYLNIYDMNISSEGNPTSGAALKGNSSIYGPFYARGTMDLSSNTIIEKGPLFIKNGNVTLNGSGQVGTAATPIKVYCDGTTPNAGDRNWYVSRLNRTVPLITLPAVDAAYLDSMYAKAIAESADNKMGDTTSLNVETTAGNGAETYTTWNGVADARLKAPGASTNYKYVGPAGGRSNIGAGTTNVTIDGSTSFGRFNYDPTNTVNSGAAYDDFAFDAVNDTLYVNGTVFIDGDLTITVPVVYKGNGAIVCNGDVRVNEFRPASGMQPDNGIPNQNFPTDGIVGLVSPTLIQLSGGGGNEDKTYTTAPDTAAALFCAQTVRLDNNLCFAGSIIASVIEAPLVGTNPHIRPSPNLKDVLSQSMPGRNTFLSTIAAWSRR